MLMGCGAAQVNSDYIDPHEVSLEASTRRLERLVSELRELGVSEEILTELINSEKGKIKWLCNACAAYNVIEINICVLCGTQRPIDTTKEWLCENCTFINPLSAKVCEVCGPEQAEPTDTNSQKTSPKENEDKEECPVCFEEYEFQKYGQHYCKQCKKAICTPCYQDLLRTKNRSCPLCRYEKYTD
jgi:hypothetical protein